MMTMGELLIALMVVFAFFNIAMGAFSPELIQSYYFTNNIAASSNLAYSLNNDLTIVFPDSDPTYGVNIEHNNIIVSHFSNGMYQQKIPNYLQGYFSSDFSKITQEPSSIVNINSFMIRKVGNVVYFGTKDTSNIYNNFNKNDFIPIQLKNPDKLTFETRFNFELEEFISETPKLIVEVKKIQGDTIKISYSQIAKPNLALIANTINDKFKQTSLQFSELKFYDVAYKTNLAENSILIEIPEQVVLSKNQDYPSFLGKLAASAILEFVKD